MSSQRSNTFHWVVVIGAIAGIVVSASAAIFSFAEVMIGHGSGAGNILRIGVGVFSLFVGLLMIIVGGISWQELHPAAGSASHAQIT
jgi:hypothetical protein